MSKRITSFLMMLLGLFMSTSAFAQLEEFEGKTVSVGETVDAFETNTWYFLHQARGGSGYCPLGEIPSSGGFMTDMGEGQIVKKMNVNDVPAGSLATEKAAYMVRFIQVDENPNAYYIQFGTGLWLRAPNGTGNSKEIKTGTIYDGRGMYNIYAIPDESNPGYFALNVSDGRGDYQELIDNNGIGNSVVTWDSGEKVTASGNSTWSIAPAIFYEPTEKEVAGMELAKLADEISAAISNFKGGTQPGCYDSALLQALQDLLEEIYMVTPDAPDYDATSIEQLQTYIEQLNQAYQAVLASKVPFTLTTGYYRIKSPMTFTQEVPVIDEGTGEEATETKIFTKYMMIKKNGETINGVWGTPEDLNVAAPALWYITNMGDGTFDVLSVNAQARFNNVSQSTAVTLSKDSENMMAFDPVVTDADGITYVDIRVSTQEANDYHYLHMGGHSSGAGVSGNLVGWSSSVNNDGTFGATEWTFEAISEADAQKIIKNYEPYENRELLLGKYDSLLTAAKENLAKAIDIQHVKIIKSADQLSSPCSDSEEGKNIGNLIDEDASTFWHSDWHESYQGGTHYFQVEMPENITMPIQATFTRRDNSGNQITQWGIYGTNNADAASMEDCELLLEWDTPFNSQTETLNSPEFETKGYKYLRMYCLAQSKGAAFFHLSEFQLGYEAENPNAQFKHMGDVGKNLQKLIEEQAELEREDITIDEYNALKEAYDAFMAKFVDPAELREVLAAKKDVVEMVVIGDNPGFWSPGTNAADYKTLYDNAKAYDEAGIYTAAQSADYIEQLNSKADEIFASANKIRTDKWYRIKFPTLDDFKDHKWDEVAGKGSGNTESLFGKFITASYLNENGAVESYITPEEIALRNNLFLDTIPDIDPESNLDLFRFVAVGDSAYMLQNKGTGMFIKANGTSGAVTLSVHPSLFTTAAIGYGLSAIAAKSITGAKQSYIHCQVSQNIIVTWDVNYPGSRSGLFIEEAGDVEPNYDGSVFNVSGIYGSVQALCFPMGISVPQNSAATLWSINSIEGSKLSMCKLDKVEAGRAFLLVFGNREEYDAEGFEEMVTLKHDYTIAATAPDNSHLLKGAFYGETVKRGVVVAEGNTLAVLKQSTADIPHNGGYISKGEEKFDLETELEIIWDENAEDGIQTALSNVAKSGAVYTLDGRLVSKKANLNDLTGFGKGIYILNGTKVVVK